MDFQHRFV